MDGFVPTLISKADAEYIRSGRWMCSESPTGAHHWVETSVSKLFDCKYCHVNRKFSVVYMDGNFANEIPKRSRDGKQD